MNGIVIKGIGIAATIIGFAASSAIDWVDEKKMEKMIEEKVNKALAERGNRKES